MPGFASARVLSAWELNSGEVFLATVRDAELDTERYYKEQGVLLDPPLNASEFEPEIYKELNKADEVRQKDSTLCDRNITVSDGPQRRPSPAMDGPPQDVNTVEIVKQGGQYQLVMDGVSYGILNSGENRFWMPRFKEAAIQDTETGSARRVVQPVLFSMRVEDFEEVPTSCVVDAHQRVVNNGTVYMDKNVIKTVGVSPYQVSSMTAGVTVLPYPLICTPAPFVTINDYSSVLDRELMLKLHYQNATGKGKRYMNKVTDAFTKLSGRTLNGVKQGAVTTFFANPNAVKDAVSLLSEWAYSLMNNPMTATAAATAATEAATAATEAAKAAPAIAVAVAGAGTVALGAVYLNKVWRYLRKRPDPQLLQGELIATERALAAALNRGPTLHRITIDKLTSMIYRITETRANGSLVSGSGNTVGMSPHDFQERGWNEEAAFMQWLMYERDTRNDQDPITGLFPHSQDSAHAELYSNAEGADSAAVTMHTVGVQGLDGSTLCNCRTEFSYVIKIKENDGSDGPTIVLDPTRINGLDAGWLAAGFNDQFRDCMRAANCLRCRLARLPSISRYVDSEATMGTVGTVVSDTTSGVILSAEPTDTQRLLLGRQIDDNKGPARTPDELRERLERVTKQKSSLEQKQSRNANNVEMLKQRVKNEEQKLDELKLKGRIERIPAQEQKLEEARQQLIQAEKQKAQYATDMASLQERQSDATGNQDNPMRFVNIFDYEKVHSRIVVELLGGPLFDRFPDIKECAETNDSDTKSAESNGDNYVEDDDDRENEPVTFWKSTSEEGGEEPRKSDEKKEQHALRSRTSLASSMSLKEYELEVDDDIHARFMEFLCPMSLTRNAKTMRFAAFLVPRDPLRSAIDRSSTVTRIMPQMLLFSSSMVSTFGNVTIMQPAAVSDKTFIQQDGASLAARSIAQARVSLRNMAALFPRLVEGMKIYGTTGHLCQIYKLSRIQSVSFNTFKRRVAKDSAASDFLALSFVPDSTSLEAMLRAEKAGGSLLNSMTQIASGRKLSGIAQVVSKAGLPVEPDSCIAAAYFSEIVAYHLIEHGVVTDDKVGFELQRVELVQSAIVNAKYSSRVIGKLLYDNYAGNRSTSKAFQQDDVSFYCLPGLSHLRTALQRLGVFSNTRSTASVELCRRVGRALYHLGSAQKSTLESFPFVCLQSSVAYVPKGVRFVEGYASAIDIHVKLCALSYERVMLGAESCSSNFRARACVCTDVVYSRPSVLKQFSLQPQATLRVITESSNSKSQSGWEPPMPSMDKSALKYRAAKLRLDIHEECLNERAATELSILNEELNRVAQMDLVDEMTRLDLRDFASADISDPVANYMIPFGITDTGTQGDLIHFKFEQQPVWVHELECAAASAVVTEESPVDIRARLSTTDKHGRPNHPMVIKVKGNSAELVLFPTNRVTDEYLSVVPPDIDSWSMSLGALCKYVNDGKQISGVSGRLSKHYRRTMHNAERLFQLILLVSSGVATPGAPENLKIVLELEDTYHMPVLLSCVCIANALAKTTVGSSCAVVLKDTEKGETASLINKQLPRFAIGEMSGRGAPSVVSTQPDKPILPALHNLFLFEQSDIAANKRKERPPAEAHEQLSNEAKIKVVQFAVACNTLFGSSTLAECETRAELMSMGNIFEIDDEKVEYRRKIIAETLQRHFWQTGEWGKPGSLCTKSSSAVCLLQSMKSNLVAAAHTFFGQTLPDFMPGDVQTDVEENKKNLKQLVSAVKMATKKGGEEVSGEATSQDLADIEKNLSRVLLFSDVQTAPVLQRTQLVQELDEEISNAEHVGLYVMHIMRAHMRMLFYATKLDMESDAANQKNTDFLTAMGSKMKNSNGEETCIFCQIQDDLACCRHESPGMTRLTKVYWEELRKMLFSQIVVGDETMMDVDNEGDQNRDTAPGPEPLKKLADAIAAWNETTTDQQTSEGRYDVKAEFIRFFMRIAAYKDDFGWFAQSGFNLYTLSALRWRMTIAQNRDAAVAMETRAESLSKIIAAATPNDQAWIKEQADQARAGQLHANPMPTGPNDTAEQPSGPNVLDTIIDANLTSDGVSTEQGVGTTAPGANNDDTTYHPVNPASAQEAETKTVLAADARQQQLAKEALHLVEAALKNSETEKERIVKANSALTEKQKELIAAQAELLEALDESKAQKKRILDNAKTMIKDANKAKERDNATRIAEMDATVAALQRDIRESESSNNLLVVSNQDKEKEELNRVRRLIELMKPWLKTLREAALLGPQSDAATEYAQSANRGLETAAQGLDTITEMIDNVDSTFNFEEILQNVKTHVENARGVVRARRDSLLERGWGWMNDHARLVGAMITDRLQQRDIIGHAWALFENTPQLIAVVTGLMGALHRRRISYPYEPPGYTIDEKVAGLFTLGSIYMTFGRQQEEPPRPQARRRKTRHRSSRRPRARSPSPPPPSPLMGNPLFNWFFIYRAVVQYNQAGNTAMPLILYNWLNAPNNLSWFETLTTANGWYQWGASYIGGLLANSAGTFVMAATYKVLSNNIAVSVLIGTSCKAISSWMSRGIQVVNVLYALSDMQRIYALKSTSANTLGPMRSFALQGVKYAFNLSTVKVIELINQMGFDTAGIPVPLLGDFTNAIVNHPKGVTAFFALGLAIVHGHQKGALDGATAVARQKLNEFVDKARHLKGVKFTDAFVSRVPDKCDNSEAEAVDEGDMPVDDPDDYGAAVESVVDEMTKLRGMKIIDPVCGNFVIVSKPQKQQPGVSACMALMLNTDIHGIGR